MRIECPSCSATYDVPDSLVTVGRVVRCARCGGEWVALPALASEPETSLPGAAQPSALSEPAVSAAAPLATTPARRLSAMDRLAAHPAISHGSAQLLRLAWAASIGALFLVAGAAYTWRDQIVEAWPPSARAYAVFGLQRDQGP